MEHVARPNRLARSGRGAMIRALFVARRPPMEIWLSVFLGPLVAIGVIVGLVRGAQALLSNEAFMRVMLSRPAAIASTCLFVALAAGLVWGLIVNPFLALLIVP